MPFLNVDDNFAEHPKVVPLSDRAFRLHVSGMCYSARHLTDGRVPTSVVERLPGYRPQALKELVEAGLWAPLGGVGLYEIHDFLDWNESGEKVRARRDAWRRRQRRHRGQPEGPS